MIVKEGWTVEGKAKYCYVYKEDGEIFLSYKVCRWYCVLKWRQELGYLYDIQHVFTKDVFPFRQKGVRYEFMPQFKVWYRKGEAPQYQVYTIWSEWYRKAFQKNILTKFKLTDIRFLDATEMKTTINNMKTMIDYNSLIEVKLLKDVI